MTVIKRGPDLDFSRADEQHTIEFVGDDDAERLAALHVQSPFSIFRTEVVKTLETFAAGREPDTVLGRLALSGASVSEIAASIEEIPGIVEATLHALERTGIVYGFGEDDPIYQIHPALVRESN